jgi:hypothetical protein
LSVWFLFDVHLQGSPCSWMTPHRQLCIAPGRRPIPLWSSYLRWPGVTIPMQYEPVSSCRIVVQCSEFKLWQPKKLKLSPGPLPRHTWLEDSKRMTGHQQRHKNHIEHYRTIQNDAMSCATETISRNVALDTPQWQRRTPQWKDM